MNISEEHLIAAINNLADAIRGKNQVEEVEEINADLFKSAIKDLMTLSGKDLVVSILGEYGAKSIAGLREQDRAECYKAIVAAAKEKA